MTTRYTGMNPDGTGNLNDMEHLKQSVRDILITPLASRLCDGNMAALCLI
ncbi:Baseplate assembly protein W [Escherichia coli]|nr:Baseplate assembly protein W [Escherichia coli]